MFKKIIFVLFIVLISFNIKAQINYNFTALAGTYTANAAAAPTPTTIFSNNINNTLSGAINIGFSFVYECATFTQFRVSTNGWLSFKAQAGAAAGNNLNTSGTRQIIAPLWDAQKTDNAAGVGQVNYKVTGTTPNRVLTVEWLNMRWSNAASGPVITYQVKLYETSNRIEFIYEPNATGVNAGSASIGLSGNTSGDFYSLNGTGASPAASKLIETSNINTKPVSGQTYRWDPIVCSGIPVGGTAATSQSSFCTSFSPTLTLSGQSVGCGLQYQWQSSAALGGPFANVVSGGTSITSGTNTTYAPTVASTTFFRCVITCTNSGSSANSSVIGVTITPVPGCNICNLRQIPSLPYTQTGQTTCGSGDNITYTNVTNYCDDPNYYQAEDVVYSFTPTATGIVTVNVGASSTFMGFTVYRNCPLSGGTCVGSAQGSATNQICVNVTAGQTYYLVVDDWPTLYCLGTYSVDLTAPGTPISVACDLSTYSASSITYSFETFVGTSLPTTDDILYNSIVNFGFQFCFGGSQYWGGYVASNGAFVLSAVPCFPNIQSAMYAGAGVATDWPILQGAPSVGTSTPRNAILAPWQDIDPTLGGTIRYYTTGTAPNRKMVVSYENIPMYSCGPGPEDFTGQIKIYESTNVIEIHVGNKGLCTSWNAGQAIMGLMNYDGTVYIPPVNATAHNATNGYYGPSAPNQWTMTNTAYRFTSPCASSGGPCAVLPVGFKNFYGENISGVNKLTWETAEESNLKEFVIERSTDGLNFFEIALQKANNKASTYTFSDNAFKPSIVNYYKITAIENSSARKSTYVIPIGGTYDNLIVSEIFPNPTENNFAISFTSKIENNLTIRIKDMYGKDISKSNHDIHSGVSQVFVNCVGLNSGIYVVEVVDNNSKTISQQKLIISN
ncbi:MAG: T9SS type A sorting domain-containing protein [Bacteroidota bacterium]|nr:T9SS type A sorting domain-containing protein [Bacteroidota bacterium]